MPRPYCCEILDHLGLVTGMFDELGIGDVMDHATQSRRWSAIGCKGGKKSTTRKGKLMGQYFAIYNLDKRQVIQPGRCHDGQRLREVGSSACGVLLALAALLAHGNEYGASMRTLRLAPSAFLLARGTRHTADIMG